MAVAPNTRIYSHASGSVKVYNYESLSKCSLFLKTTTLTILES